MSTTTFPKLLLQKIKGVFNRCCDEKSSRKVADFAGMVRIFWTSLNNCLSLVDLAGIWAITMPSVDHESLDCKSFVDFFNGVARLKYPAVTSYDFCEMLLEDLNSIDVQPPALRFSSFGRACTRAAVQELIKVDLVLKKAYASYAGDHIVNLHGGLLWEEVKRLSLGIEIDSFINFAEAYSICPAHLTTEQCISMAKGVLDQYPLSPRNSVALPVLLYPQFELLLSLMAEEVFEARASKPNNAQASSANHVQIARSSSDTETSITSFIQEFFSEIKGAETVKGSLRMLKKSDNDMLQADDNDSSDESAEEPDPQSPLLPANCMDQYSGSLKHSRQAMQGRMHRLFEATESNLLLDTPTGKGPSQALIGFITGSRSEGTVFSSRQRFASKPVVISDAIPLPECPLPVEQLLQSALAHHNLGSFQETLLFLEAARTQFMELRRDAKNEGQKLIDLPFEFEMYVLLSKGNLFRSCGEDERAMLCYMDGWELCREQQATDWDIIFVNSIGVLAYYIIRYDIALLCFDRVVRFREQEYGSDSSDAATALNNEGCSLFCLHERGEARLRFERCWLVGSKVLGHRAPRAIMMWQNLEKARRSNAATAENRTHREEMKERVCMRPDSEKLLVGGVFAIKAVAPPSKIKKGKKKVGGKKKKK